MAKLACALLAVAFVAVVNAVVNAVVIRIAMATVMMLMLVPVLVTAAVVAAHLLGAGFKLAGVEVEGAGTGTVADAAMPSFAALASLVSLSTLAAKHSPM